MCGLRYFAARATCAPRGSCYARTGQASIRPMAQADSTARRATPEATPLYRTAPHNIEAEQALLGAILVNNEALYRVSDFLEPRHFFEPAHRSIYEIAGSLIRVGKLANPVTLKTHLPAEVEIAGLTVNQYLARL